MNISFLCLVNWFVIWSFFVGKGRKYYMLSLLLVFQKGNVLCWIVGLFGRK